MGIRMTEYRTLIKVLRIYKMMPVFCILFFLLSFADIATALDQGLKLQDLIDEALRNNKDVLMAESRWKSATFRVPQAKSLPDPMFMIGYQNEGWSRYTYGEMPDAQWMFSVSQMIPFPGKLSLKSKMEEKDAEALRASYELLKQKIIAQVKERYYVLFYMYKSLDLIYDKKTLFSQIEDAATARYSSGMALQQEVLMAQAEKYMLIEKEQMIRQKIEGIEAMLNSDIGRDIRTAIGRPEEPLRSTLQYSLDECVTFAVENSPEIKTKHNMIEASEYRVNMAEKEYYPDVTLTGSIFKREKPFEDMWSLTTTFNLPVFFKKKQRSAVLEAKSILSEAQYDLESSKQMILSNVRDNYSMIKSAESLMELYREGLIPKSEQNYEAALSGYSTGRIELITLIKSLTSLLDNELLYWNQFIEREKAIARLNALTGSGIQLKK